MRVALFGQGAFGEAIARRLLEQNITLAGVIVPTAPNDPLAAMAAAAGIPILWLNNARDPQLITAYQALAPDLNVLTNLPKILPMEILSYPKKETIAFHPSLLPDHRGKHALNWAIITGKRKTGVTVFWPDEGIDTGPIMLQRECALPDNETVSGLYRRIIFPMGVDLLVEAVLLVSRDTAEKKPQDPAQGSYEKPLTSNDTRIDWSARTSTICNLIRGCDKTPGAWASLDNDEIVLYGVSAYNATMAPGQFTAMHDGLVIGTGDGSVLIQTIKDGGQLICAAYWKQRGQFM